MKKIINSLVFLFVMSNLLSQGIIFYDGGFEQAILKAQQEEKLIFVDAYATWCGPCKRMAKNVFPDKSVGAYYNDHFISLKIDMEKPAGREFARQFPVSAYPTLFYINEKGELLKKVIGGKNAEQFLSLGKSVADSYDRSGELEKLYNEGVRDYELVLKYIKALNNANKSSLKVSNDFLRKSDHLSKNQKATFIAEALVSADSRIFDLFIDNKKEIKEIIGEDLYKEKIEDACWKTLQNAIDFESTMLLDDAKLKMKNHLSDQYKIFAYSADYEFAKANANISMLNSSSLALAKYIGEKDHEKLHDMCNELFLYKSIDPSILESSETIAKMASEKSERPEYMLTYSKILHANNKTKKAIKTARNALIISDNPREKDVIQEWIESIETQ